MANLAFSVQTLQTDSGGVLRSVKPDRNGVYNKVPVAVIGLASRNNVLYDPTSFVNAVTDPRSRFAIALREGHLEGEYGHPLLSGDERQDVMRTLTIDRTRVSHYFTKMWTEPVAGSQYTLVYANVVPFGPYGQYLKDSFEDPNRNTAFSLRSLTSEPKKLPNGTLLKHIVTLVSMDSVDCPGFQEASKRYMSAESLGFQLVNKETLSIDSKKLLELPDFKSAVGFEAIECQQILDTFQSDKVGVLTEFSLGGAFDPKTKAIETVNGKKSVFHSLFDI